MAVKVTKKSRQKAKSIIKILNQYDTDTMFTAKELAWRIRQPIDTACVMLFLLTRERKLKVVGKNSAYFRMYRRRKKISEEFFEKSIAAQSRLPKEN